jgi:ElaB/YqjD/DUF883 family membrane-anchored ribosome-binding protein
MAAEIDPEVEKSRESADRLLDTLAQKLRIKRAVRNCASSMQRAAHYVQGSSLKDAFTAVDEFVRQRPAPSLLIAVAAGFVVGRILRPR